MAQVIEKICRVCGQDVANQKRTKDAAGNYYCQPCYAAAIEQKKVIPEGDLTSANGDPKTSRPLEATFSKCTSCAVTIAEDAAFCPRCGAKQNDAMSVQEEIDVTTVIALLRQYAELNAAVSMTPELYRNISEAHRAAATKGDAIALKFLDQKLAEAKAQEAKCLSECHDIKSRLNGFERGRVLKVRDLILANDKVEDAIKVGASARCGGLFWTWARAASKSRFGTTIRSSSSNTVERDSAYRNISIAVVAR